MLKTGFRRNYELKSHIPSIKISPSKRCVVFVMCIIPLQSLTLYVLQCFKLLQSGYAFHEKFRTLNSWIISIMEDAVEQVALCSFVKVVDVWS